MLFDLNKLIEKCLNEEFGPEPLTKIAESKKIS